jgi:hypothetical protein
MRVKHSNKLKDGRESKMHLAAAMDNGSVSGNNGKDASAMLQ